MQKVSTAGDENLSCDTYFVCTVDLIPPLSHVRAGKHLCRSHNKCRKMCFQLATRGGQTTTGPLSASSRVSLPLLSPGGRPPSAGLDDVLVGSYLARERRKKELPGRKERGEGEDESIVITRFAFHPSRRKQQPRSSGTGAATSPRRRDRRISNSNRLKQLRTLLTFY